MADSTALATVSHASVMPTTDDLNSMFKNASILIKSGLLPAHIKTPEAAFAIVQKGAELGIKPMYALSNIVVIQGKPTANAELMLALVYRDHGDDAIRVLESTNHVCTVAYKRRSWPDASAYSFSIEDAKTANLIKGGPWTTYPAAMLRARCISAVARMAFPDSIGGMYLSEEMGAAVDMSSDGDLRVTTVSEVSDAAGPSGSGHSVGEPAASPSTPSVTFTDGDIVETESVTSPDVVPHTTRDGTTVDMRTGVILGDAPAIEAEDYSNDALKHAVNSLADHQGIDIQKALTTAAKESGIAERNARKWGDADRRIVIEWIAAKVTEPSPAAQFEY